MKKVAATSGQSVSFATLFFAVEIAGEGSWAGSDKELNFYSRPPKRTSLAALRKNEFAFAGYKSYPCMQEKNAFERKFFSSRQPYFRTTRAAVFLQLAGEEQALVPLSLAGILWLLATHSRAILPRGEEASCFEFKNL